MSIACNVQQEKLGFYCTDFENNSEHDENDYSGHASLFLSQLKVTQPQPQTSQGHVHDHVDTEFSSSTLIL